MSNKTQLLYSSNNITQTHKQTNKMFLDFMFFFINQETRKGRCECGFRRQIVKIDGDRNEEAHRSMQ